MWAGGSGYGPYLASRRQTLSYGWHDSPVAQLAYLVEWFKEFDDGAAGMPIDPKAVPTGVSHGGPAPLRRLAGRGNDIVHWAGNESGSHMVAMAGPDGLVEDIRLFFREVA